MKIVQINNFFSSGSTGKIVNDIYSYLKENGHECYVLYGIGKERKEVDVIRVLPEWLRKFYGLCSRITGYAYAGCGYSTWNTIRLIEKIRPDVIHLHCINGHMVNIYRLLTYLKRKEIPIVITHHAEFLYTAGCGYAMECEKWKSGCGECKSIGGQRPNAWFFDKTAAEWKLLRNAYDGYKKITHCAVSKWVEERAKSSPFLETQRVITVHNGLDTEVFFPKGVHDLRTKLEIGEKKVVVHITPDFSLPIKGGVHVMEMANRFQNEDVVFLVVGVKDDSMEVPANMKLIKGISNQNELAKYYSLGDVCLLTSVKETFSMVCAESLCCGTPIVGFKAGGPETISIKEYSKFVEQGNQDALEGALREALSTSFDRNVISSKAKVFYDKKRMSQEYITEYEALVKCKHE